MKTLLIPVDFTATSDNAVSFAAQWCTHYDYTRIILLKTHYDTLFDDLSVSAEYARVSHDYRLHEREEAVERLEEICRNLAGKVAPHIKVFTAESELPLLRAIMEVVEMERPDMIMVGSDNYSYTSGSFISGNVIAIAKASPVRVMIVPAHYEYRQVHEVLVPCNFNTLEALDKLNSLHASPRWADVLLQVLNVDPKQRFLHPDASLKQAEENLHQYLVNFHHVIHYTGERDIIDGIMRFTKDHPVQLIIALPGRHSFLYNLTHRSISEAIYRNAQEPVMILK